MIGSSDSRLTGDFRRFGPRSATSASIVPSTVVPTAVSKARKSVFQATPQRTPPARQPRPQVRSWPSRSANAASEKRPASSRKAPASATATGRATNSSSRAAQSTTEPATNASPRNRPVPARPQPSSISRASRVSAPPRPMPCWPAASVPNAAFIQANDQPVAPIEKPLARMPNRPIAAPMPASRPRPGPRTPLATAQSASARSAVQSQGLPSIVAARRPLAESSALNTARSESSRFLSPARYHGRSTNAARPSPVQATSAARIRSRPAPEFT